MYKKSINRLLFCLLILFSLESIGQTENCLDFDGVDDVVTSTNASSQIANSNNGMSLSLWVFARNTAPNYPDFDGIAGLRNELDCDFYLLQLTGTTIEGRFRNSLGTTHDVIISGFQTNVWQHLVLTYDGSTLKGYLNGSLVDSKAASGSISSSSTSLLMGNVAFSSASFNLDGKVDEVGLWKKALTSSEINCMHQYGHDKTDLDLKLFYKFNQGVSNGSNSSITSITDEKGNNNAFHSGFALSGSTSNFVNGVDLNGRDSVSICKGDSLLFGGSYLKSSGVYTGAISTPGSCDSIAVLTLSIDSVNSTISLISDTSLQADLAGAAYQWIDCATNLPIAGATQREFIATQNGSYACMVTNATCSEVSDCQIISKISLIENPVKINFSCYPNPAKDKLHIQLENFEQDVQISIKSLTGKTLRTDSYKGIQEITIPLQIPSGVYLIEINSGRGRKVKKFVVGK